MQLDPKASPWLDSKSAKRVFAALGEGNARFVGGCVRNALLGEMISDFDIATKLSPGEVSQRLKNAKIAVHETGIAHGTLTAVAKKDVYEITSLRRDVSTDGRHATVAFTDDWVQDAQRRDFTINALYASPDGEVFDPTGQGLSDIKTKSIRFVGEPDARIKEDYLRILRFFRFNAYYNPDGKMDADALAACKANQTGLKQLSAERIWTELKKTLSAPAPSRVINTMFLGGILETILPEASNSEGLQLLCGLETEIELDPDPYLRLMSMAARDEIAMMRLAKRLKLSNAEKSRLLKWAGDTTPLSPDLAGKERAQAVYQAGQQVTMDRALIRAAGSEGEKRDGWIDLYNFAKNWDRPEFPITGKDLKRAGIKEGEGMGKTLEALKALWVRSGFTADKERLLAALMFLAP